jgi:hypothetical protein
MRRTELPFFGRKKEDMVMVTAGTRIATMEMVGDIGMTARGTAVTERIATTVTEATAIATKTRMAVKTVGIAEGVVTAVIAAIRIAVIGTAAKPPAVRQG